MRRLLLFFILASCSTPSEPRSDSRAWVGFTRLPSCPGRDSLAFWNKGLLLGEKMLGPGDTVRFMVPPGEVILWASFVTEPSISWPKGTTQTPAILSLNCE